MIQEFKDFVNKGGVFEAAVGLILALAFAPVVQGLVDHIIMPIVARIFGKPSFDDLRIGLGGDPDPETGQEVAIEYGSWITLVIGFLLIALVIFFLVKAYNRANPPEPEPEAGPSELDLLAEIRDNLAR
ncbi:MAG: large conductance mechanosensitive channel protein MscL [Acidimicrobiia bacterium]|nr:large conductance mechanosensitive channel protein MscL [Acidimicrobiia bacterium]